MCSSDLEIWVPAVAWQEGYHKQSLDHITAQHSTAQHSTPSPFFLSKANGPSHHLSPHLLTCCSALQDLLCCVFTHHVHYIHRCLGQACQLDCSSCSFALSAHITSTQMLTCTCFSPSDAKPKAQVKIVVRQKQLAISKDSLKWSTTNKRPLRRTDLQPLQKAINQLVSDKLYVFTWSMSGSQQSELCTLQDRLR